MATGLGSVLRWAALLLGLACLGVGADAWIRDGRIFDVELLWSGAAAPLAAAPLFFASLWFAWRTRLHLSAVSMFAGLYALSVISCVPRGPLAPAWTVQPLLAVAATCALGVGPGLVFVLLGCAGLAWVSFEWPPVQGVDALAHGMSLAAATLAAGLVGVFIHRVVVAALASEEEFRTRFRDSRKALRHREKLLRHALRVETVGDLAGLVVHQLRNQFQLVAGHVFMGKREQGENRTRRLELIAEVLHDSRPLLDQLMGLANPDDGRPCRIDLCEVADQFGDKVRRVLPSRLVFSIDNAQTPLPVTVDPRGLEHSLWNLVINAGHAMPNSGNLRIETGVEESYAWVAVQDSGCGIAAEHLAQIFEPYFTTKRPGEGTGLGLTAVSRFVRASRGELDVDSVVGKGTRFTLSFPIAPADPALAPTPLIRPASDRGTWVAGQGG